MKKIYLIMAAILIPAAIIINSLHAQRITRAIDGLIMVGRAAGGHATIANPHLISSKAIKNFNTHFGQAGTVKWYAIPDGFIAYYQLDGYLSRVYYDRQGNWRFTTRYYNEKKLPAEVRATVKRVYYDFSIYAVLEIKSESDIFHIVFIKDETAFKILRVHNAEMDVIKEFTNLP